jgi:(2Fe-2S) ferredoxin
MGRPADDPEAEAPPPDRPAAPRFDLWICQGRMCTANGSDALAARAVAAAAGAGGRCRVLRGGCYGLCEIGPNAVLRRHAGPAALPDPEVDRLSLTDAANETVYSGVAPPDIDLILTSHLERDAPVPALRREAREAALPPGGPVAEKLRRLRAQRAARRGAGGSSG